MFNKFRGYFKYRRIIEENMDLLTYRYKLRYDKLYGRLYTVMSVPPEQQEVLKKYGYQFLDKQVRKYLSSMDEEFMAIGLFDMITLTKVDTLDPSNVLIVMRYKYKFHQVILYAFGFLSVSGFIIGIYELIKFSWG